MISSGFWDVPENWQLKKFEDIVSTTSGKAFDSDRFKNKNTESAVPVIRIRDIHNATTEAYTEEEFAEKYTVEPGDLLVGMDGDFEASFWRGQRAALNQRVLKIEYTEGVRMKFLKFWFDVVLPVIHERVPKATVKHLSVNKHLKPSYIPVPPIEKQERIVNIVEEQLETINTIAQSVERLEQLTDEYENSLLAYLFAGKQESAEDYLDYIPTAQDIPNDWNLRTVGDIVEKAKNGGTPKRSESKYWGGSIDWLSSGEVRGKEIYAAKEGITQEALDETSAKLFPENSVLIAMYGATRGQSAILREEMSGNQAICCLNIDESVAIPEYVLYYFRNIKQQLVSEGKGGGQKNINQSIVLGQKIPIPPIEKQEEIIQKVEKVDMSRVNRSVEDVEKLFDEYYESVLAYALNKQTAGSEQSNKESPILSKV